MQGSLIAYYTKIYTLYWSWKKFPIFRVYRMKNVKNGARLVDAKHLLIEMQHPIDEH